MSAGGYAVALEEWASKAKVLVLEHSRVMWERNDLYTFCSSTED